MRVPRARPSLPRPSRRLPLPPRPRRRPRRSSHRSCRTSCSRRRCPRRRPRRPRSSRWRSTTTRLRRPAACAVRRRCTAPARPRSGWRAGAYGSSTARRRGRSLRSTPPRPQRDWSAGRSDVHKRVLSGPVGCAYGRPRALRGAFLALHLLNNTVLSQDCDKKCDSNVCGLYLVRLSRMLAI